MTSSEEVLKRVQKANKNNLKELDLSWLRITEEELPEELFNLTELHSLNLGYNQLSSLPEAITTLTELQSLNLLGNQLKFPPQELAELGLKHIKTYFEAAKDGTVTLKEAKIIFVGNGRVGKTSIAKQLRVGRYLKDQNSTHGVRIIPWNLELGKETNTGSGETIALNLWDFGGQEIYHATHRFFMTYRALYVLVWDCRTEEKVEQEPEKYLPYPYWLDKIRALSSKSPILMVQNKIDREQRGVDDQNHLIEKYNVQEFINVSAEDNTHISSLKAKIRRQLASHPSLSRMIGIEFPKPWQEIRTKLKQLNDEFGEHELNKSDYTRLCTEEGIDEKSSEVLLEYMHVTGDVFFIPNLNVSRIRSLLIPSGHWIVFMNCLMMKLQHQIKIIRVNSLSAVFTKSWSDSAKINALIFWNF